MSRCLSKMVDQDQKNWDLKNLKIETVLMGYRASRQASTKYSPHFLLFQKEMRLPIDNDQMRSHMFTWRMTSKFQLKPLRTREKLFEATSSSILLAQSEQKELYDRKHMYCRLVEREHSSKTTQRR